MPAMLDREGLCTRCSTFLSVLGEIQGWVQILPENFVFWGTQ